MTSAATPARVGEPGPTGGGATTSTRLLRRGPRPRTRPVVRAAAVTLTGLATLAVLGACATWGPEDLPPDRTDVAATAADVALAAPSPGPTAADRLRAVPDPGAVEVLDGPFLDRVVVHDAVLADGVVAARIDVVKDVSELLALEVDVAWYDDEGALVGSSRYVVDPEAAEEFHSTAGISDLPIEVRAPGGVSATLAVPVLVNE